MMVQALSSDDASPLYICTTLIIIFIRSGQRNLRAIRAQYQTVASET